MVPSRGRLRPLRLDEVEITGGVWATRQQVNADATLAHCHGWMERLGWVANFTRAVDGTIAGNHQGMMFADSDVYKLMEAMAWEVGRSGSADADERFRSLTVGHRARAGGRRLPQHRVRARRTAAALQRPRVGPRAVQRRPPLPGGRRPGPHPGPTSSSRSHGASPTTCATRSADGGIERVCGHPEIELGLVELARLTGEQRYLDQAAPFVERRGRGTLGEIQFGPAYFQDDIPIRDATVFRGHAVRALYLAAGAVDVAVETGDDELLGILVAQWENTIARRTYLTGGMGSQHTGEAFGDDFVLPPDRAYSETCAGIASVMLAWRLLLATGEARFADLIERTLHNVVATSPAPDGRHFFYANPLHQRVPGTVPPEDEESKRAATSLRAPWFLVACCPTNVARTLASLAAYVATADDGGIQIHQYAVEPDPHDARRRPHGRARRLDRLSRTTARSRCGSPRPTAGRGRSRCGSPRGRRAPSSSTPDGRRPVAPGTVVVERPFAVGDEVTLTLPMAPRWTRPDPRIDAVRGCVAVERGPLVLCAESVDLPGDRHVDLLRVDPSVPPRDRRRRRWSSRAS